MQDWRHHLASYGDDPISASTLQPDLEVFAGDAGYLAWRRVRGYDLVLGPPVCAPEERPALLRRFLEGRRRPFFCYLREEDARQLARVAPGRFYFASIGVEHVLDLRASRLRWAAPIEGALRKARRAGLRLTPCGREWCEGAGREQLATLTARFLARSQQGVEMRFTNRPLLPEGDPGRLFLMEKEDREGQGPFGYVVLDPYRTPEGAGWLLNMVRFQPTRLWGVYLSTVALVAEALHREGAVQLSLGLSPLHRTEVAPELRNSALLDWQMRLLVSQRRRFYDFTALEAMKDGFGGEAWQRYVALPTRFIPGPLSALVEAMGLTWSELTSARKQRPAAAPLPEREEPGRSVA
jgi:lysylphosphatidylglycerol synthetase-like protein (DUF2156 family)